MTTEDLARSYLFKAEKRLKILDLLLKEKDYSDVIREAQEAVELSLKAMLRAVGIEPSKINDVSPLIIEHGKRFKGIPVAKIRRLARISKELRKERELAFYGDIDFIPTEEYTKADALKAIKNTLFVVNLVKEFIAKKR